MTSTQNWVKTAISSWHRRFEKIVPIRDKAGAKLSTNCTGSTIWRSRHDSREFKQRRFLATHVNWKRTFCTLEPWFWTNGRLKLVLLSAPLGILATTTVMKRQKKKQNSKTTTLRVHHTFLYIPLPSLHDYEVKLPNITFQQNVNRRQQFSFLFLKLGTDF